LGIAKEGLPFILVPLIFAVVAGAFGIISVAIGFLAITAFMVYFFRDPERVIPTGSDIIVSPADGRVTKVQALDPGSRESPIVVSIFLSPIDVHINRSPIAGTITEVAYTRGKFLMATDPRASLLNEQNSLTIQGEKITVVCKQVAGILARRIVCWKNPSDTLALGERFGLIKFSSRTDLIMPAEVDVLVKVGSRVKGGMTVIGRISK
jgi:phosphatidylserine decarboxylase